MVRFRWSYIFELLSLLSLFALLYLWFTQNSSREQRPLTAVRNYLADSPYLKRNPKKSLDSELIPDNAVPAAPIYHQQEQQQQQQQQQKQHEQQQNGQTKHKPQQIHVAVVSCKNTDEIKNERSIKETLTMIKSILLFTKDVINVHLFTDAPHDRAHTVVNTWPASVRAKLRLLIEPVEYPFSSDDNTHVKSWWSPCASFRLFLPTVMAETDAVIYVDTDVLFLSPIEEVWNHFELFDGNQTTGVARRVGWSFNVPDAFHKYIKLKDGSKTQVNTGVMLMNLTRMREANFNPGPPTGRKVRWSDKLLFPLYNLYKEDDFTDQLLVNIIFHYNPDRIYLLPCKFNYHHKFCFDDSPARRCASAQVDGAAIIHGSGNTFYNNYSPSFRVMYNGMVQMTFDKDIRKDLIEPLDRALLSRDVERHKHCGKRSILFLRYLRRFVGDEGS